MARFMSIRINGAWLIVILCICSVKDSFSSKLSGFSSSIQFTEKTNSTPESRTNAAFTITDKGDFYLFGGLSDKGTYLSDFYRNDSLRWIKILESKHSPGSNEQASLFSDKNGNIYMIGGEKFSVPIKDIMMFNPGKNEWTKLNFKYGSLPSLNNHSITFDKENLIFYLVGGYVDEKLNTEVYAVSIKEFSIKIINSIGIGPTPTTLPILHLYENKLFVYGGYKANGEFNQEMFILDFEAKNEWRNSYLVFVDEKSKEKFNTKLLDIRGVGDKDLIYIFNPSGSNLFKIQISDYSSIEFSHSIREIPSDIYGYNLAFYDQILYFYGGIFEKEYISTIKSVSVKTPKATISDLQLQTSKLNLKMQDLLSTSYVNSNSVNNSFSDCPSACSGNGKCLNSVCHCNSNFAGADCSVPYYEINFMKSLAEYSKYVVGLVAASVVSVVIMCYLKKKPQNLYFK